jgi:hypothetical protein
MEDNRTCSGPVDVDEEFDRIGDLFDALGGPARCRILVRVDAAEDPLQVETLAGQLANGAATSTGVRTSLAHVHLPKLDEYGLVEYDSEALAVWSVPATGRALDAIGAASDRLRQ